MSQPGKVDRQPGYVLHTQAYRETSLLVDVLTRDHGRLVLVARGARRPKAELRGVLLPFHPLLLAWFGKGEVRTLHSADWQGGLPQLSGRPLLCGFYFNELLMRLTAREDPLPALYPLYGEALQGLAGAADLGSVVRRFEMGLVRALGYSPLLSQDAAGRPIERGRHYFCRPGEAPDADASPAAVHGVWLSGATLQALADDDYTLASTQREARSLTRLLLAELLDGTPLMTPRLLEAGAGALSLTTGWPKAADPSTE